MIGELFWHVNYAAHYRFMFLLEAICVSLHPILDLNKMLLIANREITREIKD